MALSAPAANTFLLYLKPRECVCWLAISSCFCWTKSKNWSRCSCFWMYCKLLCRRLL